MFAEYKMRIWESKYDKEIDLDWSEIMELLGDTGAVDNYRKSVRFQVDNFRNTLSELKLSSSEYWKVLSSSDSDTVSDFQNKETISQNNDGSVTSEKIISANKNDLVDDVFLLKQHGYDPLIWKVKSSKHSWWNVQKKGGVESTLYSSRITVEKLTNEISLEYAKQVFEDMCKNKPDFPAIQHKKNDSSKMLEVNIADFHFGKLAFEAESGEAYNNKIAKRRFESLISDIAIKAQDREWEKILFVYSQDFFHFDTVSTSTTAGTVVDSDLKWQELYTSGVKMLIWAIDTLSAIAPVHTFYICSNHDETTSFYAINHLEAWYRNSKDVTIDASPIGRKYIEYGKSLIGFTHGDKERKRLASLMSVEQPEAWGRTMYHEFHCGHFHSEIAKEEAGVIIRYISSPSSTDAWHYKQGYVGALKKAQCFVWDKENGNEEIWNIGV